MGNLKKDQVILSYSGILNVDFGNKDMKTCLEGTLEIFQARFIFYQIILANYFKLEKGPMVGVMAWDGMQKDLTHCIAWQKNVGF